MAAKQQGSALILAVLAVGLVVAISVELTLHGALLTAQTRNRLWYEQQYQYLKGGEQNAIQRLKEWYVRGGLVPPIGNQLDVRYELPEGGRVELVIRDQLGKFNLNLLTLGSTANAPFPDTVHQRRFIRLLRTFPELVKSDDDAVRIAATVTDWVDRDTHVGTGDGNPANRFMASVAELRAVPGISPALYNALEPHVMVSPSTTTAINLNAATLNVLRALPERGGYEPVDAYEVESIRLIQQSQAFQSVEDFRQVSGWGDQLDTAGLAVQGNLFAIHGKVYLGQNVSELYSLVQHQGQDWDVVWRNPYGY